MVPFEKICPKLAKDERRSVHFEDDAKTGELLANELRLFESYCTEKDCDCRRVILTVASRNRIEATISFGFDADDDLRGPFIDPISRQGAYAAELLSLVNDVVLADPEYVARLERHYAITKDIIAGRLRPEDAQPSPRLMQPTEIALPSAAPPLREATRVVEPELIGASFEIQQAVHDADGEYDEHLATAYREELGIRFAESPEAQPMLESGSDLGWAETMVHYGIDYLRKTPLGMSARDVAEVVFDIFPRKVSMEAEQAGEVITELRAFWKFLQREYQLKNAARILELLGPGAEERLYDELADPANFGMAKSFFSAGKKAGFDMTTEAGLAEFTRAYNSGILNNRGFVGRPTLPQEPSRRPSMFADDEPTTQFANRADRRSAERAKLREDKKRHGQAKNQNRR